MAKKRPDPLAMHCVSVSVPIGKHLTRPTPAVVTHFPPCFKCVEACLLLLALCRFEAPVSRTGLPHWVRLSFSCQRFRSAVDSLGALASRTGRAAVVVDRLGLGLCGHLALAATLDDATSDLGSSAGISTDRSKSR